MKYLLSLLLFLPLLAPAQKESPYEARFWEQIQQTCVQGTLVWEKSVEETGENATHGLETHVFDIDCASGEFQRTDAEAPDERPGPSEFHYLFEYNCYNPYLKDYFDLREEKGVEATLKADAAGETPLQKQVFETDAAGTIRYAEAHVLKENMLYDLEVTVKVWFGENGHYQRHEIETYTRPALKKGVRTLIKARIVS